MKDSHMVKKNASTAREFTSMLEIGSYRNFSQYHRFYKCQVTEVYLSFRINN